MIYCPKCGKKLEGLVATPYFCYHCGFRFIIPGFGKSAFQIFKEKNKEKKLLKNKICKLKIKKIEGEKIGYQN
jgi:DNA-directed RNA polymerase subunit RPC12/RpoP